MATDWLLLTTPFITVFIRLAPKKMSSNPEIYFLFLIYAGFFIVVECKNDRNITQKKL